MTEQLFLYSLRSAFVLTLLYVPYMLLLRKESFFRLNRMILLLILLLSLVLPVLDVHHLSWEGLAPVQNVLRPSLASDDARAAIVMLPEVTVQAGADASAPWSPWQWLSLFFVVVTAGVALWHVLQILWMSVVVKRGSLWHQVRDGVHIYCHADDVAPYSWMRSVVISERDYCENGREILLHEMAHIRACHSWDLLFLAVVQTLQWWNPLVYILGGSLRDVHEYEADDSVLRHGVSARAYQLLLIKKVVGSGSYAFANNFDHSLIKKRITMMQKTKSSKWMCSKALYLLPVATLALSAFATVSPSRSAANLEGEVSTLTQNNQANVWENVADSTLILRNATLYSDEPAVMPRFPGSEHELWKFIGSNVRYPKEAQDLGVQGRVIVRFLVEKDGTLSNIRVENWTGRKDKGETTILRQVMVTAFSRDNTTETRERTPEEEAAYQAGVEAIKAEVVRVIKAMPKWVPGYLDKAKTQPCATNMAIPMQFRLNIRKNP